MISGRGAFKCMLIALKNGASLKNNLSLLLVQLRHWFLATREMLALSICYERKIPYCKMLCTLLMLCTLVLLKTIANKNSKRKKSNKNRCSSKKRWYFYCFLARVLHLARAIFFSSDNFLIHQQQHSHPDCVYFIIVPTLTAILHIH